MCDARRVHAEGINLVADEVQIMPLREVNDRKKLVLGEHLSAGVRRRGDHDTFDSLPFLLGVGHGRLKQLLGHLRLVRLHHDRHHIQSGLHHGVVEERRIARRDDEDRLPLIKEAHRQVMQNCRHARIDHDILRVHHHLFGRLLALRKRQMLRLEHELGHYPRDGLAELLASAGFPVVCDVPIWIRDFRQVRLQEGPSEAILRDAEADHAIWPLLSIIGSLESRVQVRFQIGQDRL
mmetsp:Transcript_16495/g.62723  ORF Transcript_16495/g.62723 Transcript_16495/m.62723 type:complete len:236 (-) Transcript_16495:200-907(-)